ncbi:MAG TPA: hypothetical protein PKV42_02725 [Thiobacillus sp.]|nr:hypothetical protein [Thiobacillus sp.]HQT32715.1 hypothetical protein [Thiobacillus sp.]
MIAHKNNVSAVIAALVLTFIPSQTRRKSSLPGGSAAKVFEPRPQKTKLKTARQGEFFAARPAGSISGNSGMSGSPSFGYFSWRDKKSN